MRPVRWRHPGSGDSRPPVPAAGIGSMPQFQIQEPGPEAGQPVRQTPEWPGVQVGPAVPVETAADRPAVPVGAG